MPVRFPPRRRQRHARPAHGFRHHQSAAVDRRSGPLRRPGRPGTFRRRQREIPMESQRRGRFRHQRTDAICATSSSASPQRQPWTEESLTIILGAKGHTDFVAPTRLDAATLQLRSGGDQFDIRLLQPVADLSLRTPWLLDLQMQGHLDRWPREARPAGFDAGSAAGRQLPGLGPVDLVGRFAGLQPGQDQRGPIGPGRHDVELVRPGHRVERCGPLRFRLCRGCNSTRRTWSPARLRSVPGISSARCPATVPCRSAARSSTIGTSSTCCCNLTRARRSSSPARGRARLPIAARSHRTQGEAARRCSSPGPTSMASSSGRASSRSTWPMAFCRPIRWK